MPYPESLEIVGVPLERWDAALDLPVLLTMAQDEAIRRFIGMPRDEAGLASWSARFAEHWEQFGFGLWAVRPRDGVGAGWLGACHPRWHPEFEAQVELAWSVTVSLRGRGLVTRAARTAADACFADLELDEVIAFVDPGNAASLAVAGRLGMRRTGSTRHPEDGVVLDTFSLARPSA